MLHKGDLGSYVIMIYTYLEQEQEQGRVEEDSFDLGFSPREDIFPVRDYELVYWMESQSYPNLAVSKLISSTSLHTDFDLEKFLFHNSSLFRSRFFPVS